MGIEYHLKCIDCDDITATVEYSIVGYYQFKSIPNDPDTVQDDWTPFLVKHSGHRIQFLDVFGKQTDPKKTTGGYILGLTPYNTKEADSQ